MFPNPAWPYLRLFDDDQRIIGMDEAVATALSGDTYADKVRAIFGSSLIDYRQLREGSGTLALDSSPKAHAAGTISGATWTANAGKDGGPALLYDGVNDFTNFYSAALNADFNGQSFTVSCWVRVANSGVWTDATNRYVVHLLVDANNDFYLLKNTTNNTFQMVYFAGGTFKSAAPTLSITDWFHVAVTCSKTGDALKIYINGIQSGATLTGLGSWVGALSSNGVVIGASNAFGVNPWSGYIRDVAIGNSVLSDAQIAQLAVA